MALSVQVVGFQCVVEQEVKGKKVEKKVGRVYTARSACEQLVDLYKRSGAKAWLSEVRKVDGVGNESR